MHGPIPTALRGSLIAILLIAGCHAREAPREATAVDVRIAAREAFLASDATLAVLSRLEALGCEAGPWGLYRWPVGVTVLDGRAGAAIVENVDCGEGRHAQLVITAAGAAGPEAPLRVSVAAVVVTLGADSDPILLLPDSGGALRELAMTREVSAEIDRALTVARGSTGAALAPLLSASDLDEVAGACRRAFRNFGPDDLASVIAADIPTRGDCATCMSDVAHCLGVMSRLSETHNACMATLYCANRTDADGVREALGGEEGSNYFDLDLDEESDAALLARWFGGEADCSSVATEDADVVYCAGLYNQGGAAARDWVLPVDEGCVSIFGFGSPSDFGCDERTACFSTRASAGVAGDNCDETPDVAAAAGAVYWNQIIHRAVDCAADVDNADRSNGTEVRAAGPGRVLEAHAAYNPGTAVVIEHALTPTEAVALGLEAGSVLRTLYGHLQEVAVEEGQLVEANQRLGESIEHPNPDHVHWEMYTYTGAFTCRDGARAVSPGYWYEGWPEGGIDSDWLDPVSNVSVLQDANAAPNPTAAEATGFDTLEDWLARAMSSEGLTRDDLVEALEDGTLFVPTEGALAGIFALTDLTAARDAGYFANFATLQRLRSGYLGGGPGTQFYCATEMDTLYSCHPPLCFGAPAGTTSDGVTSDCFEVNVECELGLCSDPDMMIATLAPLPTTIELDRPVGGWNASSLAYWPRAAVPLHVDCEYVLPTDDRCPTEEATYMPSRYMVSGSEVLTLACEEPMP